MKSSIRISRIAGIDIGIHYSWILIFILVASTLAFGFFPSASPNHNIATYWIAGLTAAILLFASVLLHELAHSLVAKAKGISVHSITLFIFGGVSNLEQEAKVPSIEFIMAIAGPLSSLGIAVVFWVLFVAIQPGIVFSDFFQFGGWLPQSSIVGATLLYLSLINLLLAGFNILPGFPLDGGRVLRSVIWGATSNFVRATNVATFVGRLLGWTFIAIGVLNIAGFQILFFSPGLISGIWIGFIGWFLSSAADSSRREVTTQERLNGVKVKDAMIRTQESISPSATVEELVRGVFDRRFSRAVPVCDGRTILGIVTIADVRRLPQEKWTTTQVQEIMTRNPLYTIRPEDDLSQALKLISQHDLNQVLVVADGQCTGMLSRAEIIQYLQLAQDLRINKGKAS